MIEQVYMAGMNDQQRLYFLSEYNSERKDEVVGVLLAFFLGTFGAHKFYMGQTGLGLLYLCFFWTGVPTIISLIECFFMPGLVRRYNNALAAMIVGRMGVAVPAVNVFVNTPPAAPYSTQNFCAQCGQPLAPGALFCASCGAKV